MSSSTLAALTLLQQIGQHRINGGGTSKMGIRPSMFLPFLLFALFTFSLTSASLADDDGLELEGIGQRTNIDIEAKSCTAIYECWPTEPVLDDGRPLMMMMTKIVKRLNIGSHQPAGRGMKCRCREGQCTFYSMLKRRFFNCQEL